MTDHHQPITLQFAAACSDVHRARDLAQRIGGTAYVDERPDTSQLPFSGLVVGVSDDVRVFNGAADVGLYVICQRVIRPGAAGVYGLFPLIHHPHKNHDECDRHWRDVHAPLALEHHAYMTHYLQLSVVHTMQGTAYDGFALCGFETVSDLRERFFTTDSSREVISRDIQNFADTRKSPRRLIATPTVYGV